MRISPIQNTKLQNNIGTKSLNTNNNKEKSQNPAPSRTFKFPPQGVYTPAFLGLMRIGENLKPATSFFFRDYEALMSATNMLRENFPNGATILDYGCSDGEEALSLYMLLGDDKKKFKITGIDTDEDIIRIANQGVYSIYRGSADRFLMPNMIKDPTQEELAETFHKTMKHAKEPDEPLNNSPKFYLTYNRMSPKSRKQLFYRPRSGVLDNIEYKTGTICNLDREQTEGKIGAILFRNAFYQLMNSSDGEDLFIDDDMSKIAEKYKDILASKEGGKELIELLFTRTSVEEKQAIADEIIDKAYGRLEIGGVFVLGNSENESIFFADDDTPDEDVVRFGDIPAVKERKQLLEETLNRDYSAEEADFPGLMELVLAPVKKELEGLIKRREDIRILKKTPMQKALERDGRFTPAYTSSVSNMPGFETPTVWVKVK